MWYAHDKISRKERSKKMKTEKKQKRASQLNEQIEILSKEIVRVEAVNNTLQKRFENLCKTNPRDISDIDDLSQRIEINKIMLRQMNRALERMKKKYDSFCHKNGTNNGERVC